ncbi:MAG: lysophospholipid acyltransferase family protein [Desulfurivibrio sp.]
MRFQVEKVIFNLLLKLVQLLPRRVVLACGRGVGRLVFLVDVRHRRVALANVAIAFPDASPAEAKAIVRRCFQFFGAYILDMLSLLNRGLDPARFDDFEFAGLEHCEAAYAKGKGVIFFSGHYGPWEMMALAHGWQGYPMGVVVRELDNPHLETLLRRFRTLTGNFIIEKTQAFRPMLKAMRENKGLAIMIDQNESSKNRLFVDFFGRPAATTPAVALLRMKTDAALIPVISLPLPGNRYRFTYLPEVEITRTGDRDRDILGYTQACTAVLEEQIRAHPQYWLWMHRRWKSRPEGEASTQN